MEDLKTWEGLFAMAEQYAAWTDNQTPDIPDDGKNFFVHDYHFNYFQVGVESLGEISLREKTWHLDRNSKQCGNLCKSCAVRRRMAPRRLCNGTVTNRRSIVSVASISHAF